ncbi:MAG: zinc ribbon domain-containing protein [Betaproteobacteria bacterium]|nr:zinc ribbon domain-containing protein [Betaproteobacteria bacterium]
MPIYEYRCSECGFQDEFLQKLSDPLMTVCPSCGKESLKKLLSAAGFQLKGSGWYATDFKGSGSKPAAAADSKTDSKTETKTDSKTDSKTETKSDTKSSGVGASSSDSSAAAAPKAAPAGTSG